jgi:exonuclease VII large subunit
MTTVSTARPARRNAGGTSVVPVRPAVLPPARRPRALNSGREIELKTAAIPSKTGGGAITRRSSRRVLSAEGLFVAQTELSLPLVPQRVWLVGPEGAGLESLIGVFDRSPWRWSVIFVPTSTDGADAPWACADAISAAPEEAQVIVLLGPDKDGSSSKGASNGTVYDSEPVARAICSAKAPVICALGNRGDLYLAEECAWGAVTTPREAGDLLCRRMAHTFNQVQVRYHNIALVADQHETNQRTPVGRIRPPAEEALGEQRIFRAEDAAGQARQFVFLLAVVTTLLVIVALGAVLR